MKQWVEFVLVAVVVFVFFAGSGFLIFQPDAFSTAPTSIVSLLLCWPVAYLIVYRRDETTTLAP